MPPLGAALRAAPLAEVVWREPSGGLAVHGAVPLALDDQPVLALPYASVDLAGSLGSAGEVLLTLTEPRGAGRAFRPLALRCAPRLVPDPRGERFVADLLEQELLRYPPSRLLADSRLLRREHWWWLPRLLVHLDVRDVDGLHPRPAGSGHLLAVDAGDRVAAVVVDLADAGVAPVDLELLGPAPPAGRAVLFGQEATPDMERWGRWCWRGDWDGRRLRVTHRPGAVGLPPVPNLLARWLAARALSRACRRALG